MLNNMQWSSYCLFLQEQLRNTNLAKLLKSQVCHLQIKALSLFALSYEETVGNCKKLVGGWVGGGVAVISVTGQFYHLWRFYLRR